MEVKVTHYSKRGEGLAPLAEEGRKVEVPGAVVGDLLKVAIHGKRGKRRRASILNVLTPSPDRVEPRCSHALECGGCSFQQVSYEAELKMKEEWVRSLFTPFMEGVTFYPILGCENPWAYRNKMEFSFSEDLKGEKFLGLNIAGGRGKVLNLKECHLISPWFMDVLKSVKNWWDESGLHAYNPPKDEGTLRTLTVREGKRTGKKLVMLTISGHHDYFVNGRHLKEFKEAVIRGCGEDNPSIFLRIHRAVKGKPTEFYEMHLHGPSILHEMLHLGERTLHYHLSPSSFFQPNTLQAEKLFQRALAMAEIKATDRVYDLYCGLGTFGALFSPHVKKVIGIESHPYAVCDAEATIERNHLDNFSVIKGDVGAVLEQIQLPSDLIILDPPRAGLDDKALGHVLRLDPPKILYVSCNPETQFKNISELIQKGDYKLKSLQPVDQFPHTPHLENIAYLEKTSQ